MWRHHAVKAPPQPTDLSALASPPLRRGQVGTPGSSYTRTAANLNPNPSYASPLLVPHTEALHANPAGRAIQNKSSAEGSPPLLLGCPRDATRSSGHGRGNKSAGAYASKPMQAATAGRTRRGAPALAVRALRSVRGARSSCALAQRAEGGRRGIRGARHGVSASAGRSHSCRAPRMPAVVHMREKLHAKALSHC